MNSIAEPAASRFKPMGRLLALLLAGIVLASAPSEASAAERRLVEDRGGPFDMSGFKDAATGESVIPRRFERVMEFSEGLAAVRDKGLWGYVDQNGQAVVAPRFDLGGNFHNGLAEILMGNRIGLIDRTGRIVAEPQFSWTSPFTKTIVLARSGVWMNSLMRGYERLDVRAGPNNLNGRLFQIGRGWITDETTDIVIFDPAQELVWAKPKDSQFYGLRHLDGSWVTEPRYAQVNSLTNGLALVHNWQGTPHTRDGIFLTGAVNAHGELVIPLKAWTIFPWTDGHYLVREGGKAGLFDENGRLIGGRFFDQVTTGLKVRIGDQWSFLRKDGKLVPERDYFEETPICGGRLKIRTTFQGNEESYQIIGHAGHPIAPKRFDYLYAPSFNCDGLNVVRIGKAFSPESRWGFVDANGLLTGHGLAFEALSDFTADRALVKLRGKWGLIDRTGRFAINPDYDALWPAGFGGGQNGNGLTVAIAPPGASERWSLFVAKKNDRLLALDAGGAERPLPPEYDPVRPPTPKTRLTTSGGLRFQVENGLWGMVDADGQWIVPPRYRALHEFSQGVAWAPIDEKRQWCPVGPDGVVRNKPDCEAARHPFIMTHHEPEKLADDAYESSVLWSRAYLEHRAGLRDEAPKMIGDRARGQGSWSIHR